MFAIAVALLFCLSLAGGVFAMVAMGIEGRGRDRAPKVAEKLGKAARHLNGDGQPPRALKQLLHRWAS
jgi:hypothetical protein